MSETKLEDTQAVRDHGVVMVRECQTCRVGMKHVATSGKKDPFFWCHNCGTIYSDSKEDSFDCVPRISKGKITARILKCWNWLLAMGCMIERDSAINRSDIWVVFDVDREIIARGDTPEDAVENAMDS